jgi:DmsE family decaheme c-type cytochrome
MKHLSKMMALFAFVACMATATTIMAAEGQPATEAQSAVQAASPVQAAAPAPAATKNQLPEMGADALSPAKASLKRDAICTRCHDESEATPILSIYQTKHGVKGDARTPNCQTCHGESEKHVRGDMNGKTRTPPDVVFKKGVYAVSDDKERSAQCLNCHKGSTRSNWEGSQHQNNQVACNTCHIVHAPADKVRIKQTQTEICYTCHKEQRAQSHRISTHPIDAGKVVCSQCHNPHGSTGPKLLIKNTVNETCYTCHAEKRGPFLWEHSPVVDNCTSCHTPHGSTNAPMLIARAPWLCQECHSGDHGAAVNSGANLLNGNIATVNGLQAPGNVSAKAQVAARACLNCHVLIHGSNHPAGAKFQR